jgi:hypothetical protein
MGFRGSSITAGDILSPPPGSPRWRWRSGVFFTVFGNFYIFKNAGVMTTTNHSVET